MKKKLTLSIEDGVIELARLENINISGIIEEYLQKYLGTNGIEEIEKKIKTVETELQALLDRKKELLRQGESMTRSEDLCKNIMEELHSAYVLRRNQGINSHDLDFDWLNSPKNQQRCKMLGKEPIELVGEIRSWYDKNNGGSV